MEIVLNNGFCEITSEEQLYIDGGIDWNLVGGTIATGSGAYIGANIGSAAGPVGTVVGGIVGGATGAIIYSLWD